MATIDYNRTLMLQDSTNSGRNRLHATSVWEEAFSWLALLPVLFITVGGNIQTSSAPVAFRITAMEQDSPLRKLLRLACSVLILYFVSTRARDVLAVCRRSKLLLLLPLVAMLSVLWSQNPRHSLIDALNLLLTTLFAVYLYLRFPGKRLVSFLAFAAFITLLLCALAVVAFPTIGIDAYQQGAWRGILLQRNNCAEICTLFLVVGLHTPVRALAEQVIRVSVILLSMVFIVMSGSRTGWLLAALALALTYGLRFVARIRSLDRIVVLMAIAVPTILLGFFVADNFTQLLAVLDKDPTLTQRTIIWHQVIPSIAKRPLLGYGYSAFWAGLNGESINTVLVTGWMEAQAQDGYLDVLLQLGFAGLIPLLVLFIRAFAQGAGVINRKMLTPSSMLAVVLLPVILVGNIGESFFLLPLSIGWFYCLLAVLILGLRGHSVEEA